MHLHLCLSRPPAKRIVRCFLGSSVLLLWPVGEPASESLASPGDDFVLWTQRLAVIGGSSCERGFEVRHSHAEVLSELLAVASTSANKSEFLGVVALYSLVCSQSLYLRGHLADVNMRTDSRAFLRSFLAGRGAVLYDIFHMVSVVGAGHRLCPEASLFSVCRVAAEIVIGWRHHCLSLGQSSFPKPGQCNRAHCAQFWQSFVHVDSFSVYASTVDSERPDRLPDTPSGIAYRQHAFRVVYFYLRGLAMGSDPSLSLSDYLELLAANVVRREYPDVGPVPPLIPRPAGPPPAPPLSPVPASVVVPVPQRPVAVLDGTIVPTCLRCPRSCFFDQKRNLYSKWCTLSCKGAPAVPLPRPAGDAPVCHRANCSRPCFWDGRCGWSDYCSDTCRGARPDAAHITMVPPAVSPRPVTAAPTP